MSKQYAKYYPTPEDKALIARAENCGKDDARAVILALNRRYTALLKAEIDTTVIRIASKNLRNRMRNSGVGEIDSCKYRRNVKTSDVRIDAPTAARIYDGDALVKRPLRERTVVERDRAIRPSVNALVAALSK